MMMHPYYMLEHVRVRQDALYAEAERSRLLRSARAARKAARVAARTAAVPLTESRSPRPAGTLAACGRHVAGSAR
jgi:hypothetical protein